MWHWLGRLVVFSWQQLWSGRFRKNSLIVWHLDGPSWKAGLSCAPFLPEWASRLSRWCRLQSSWASDSGGPGLWKWVCRRQERAARGLGLETVTALLPPPPNRWPKRSQSLPRFSLTSHWKGVKEFVTLFIHPSQAKCSVLGVITYAHILNYYHIQVYVCITLFIKFIKYILV